MLVSRIMQHLRHEDLRKGSEHQLYHIVPDVWNDHLSSASKRPDQLLRKEPRTGPNEAWWLAVQLRIDRSDADIHEGDCLVIRSVESFVGVETQGDSTTEVFGGRVEDDLGHRRFVSEGPDEHDEGRTSTGSHTEGRKECPGQEQ